MSDYRGVGLERCWIREVLDLGLGRLDNLGLIINHIVLQLWKLVTCTVIHVLCVMYVRCCTLNGV